MLLTGFDEDVKLTNHSGLQDAKFAWYSPSFTHWICRGREGNLTHWTVRCWACLILSECYSPNLPNAWSWPTTLDCQMSILSDTLRMLLTGFDEDVKLTNHSGLWEVDLIWYSPSVTHWICRGREGNLTHWTVRCRACLILSECYSPNLPNAWSWPITLDCQMSILSDTLRMLLTEFAEDVKLTNHSGLQDAEFAWYSPNASLQICLYGLKHGFEIPNFRPTWSIWLLYCYQFKLPLKVYLYGF